MTTVPSHDNSAARVSLWPWVYLAALGYLALHLATSTRYGYFRDALYNLACSEHLDFGYVDQPPLIGLLAWVVRHTFGTSLPALIFLPALAGAARVVLIAAFARELGGRRFGVALAVALAVTPGAWWVIDHQFGVNAFESLLAVGCAYVVLRLIKTRNPRWWLVFGLLAGIGLENKYSIAVFASALVVGLLVTPSRKLLWTPWLLAGGGVALLIFLPNLLWNIQHDWPFFELRQNIRAAGNDELIPPGAYLVRQILLMNPATFPFWLGGLLFYLFAREMKPYRAFGWAFVFAVAFFTAAHGKDYYCAPAYSVLLAAGGVATERLLVTARLRTVLKAACFAWLAGGVALLLPLVLPVLPVETFLRYQSRLPMKPPRGGSFVGAPLPQYFADQFYWPEMVAAVARVYHSLTPDEQAKTAIYCNNYGEAAAVDFFGPRHGLPKAISGHLAYYLWGPRQYTGEVVILVGVNEADARRGFDSVEVAATQHNPYALAFETRPILLCRGPKWNLQTDWPRFRSWHEYDDARFLSP